MPNAEIPEIRNLPESVLSAVGENVEIWVLDKDELVSHSSHYMIDKLVNEMFTREGVKPNRDLELLCILAARIAVAKLALSDGLEIGFGGNLFERNPREVINVKLHPDVPLVREAKVTRHT